MSTSTATALDADSVLVLKADTRERLSSTRTNSHVRAACRVIADYLSSRTIEVGGGRQLGFTQAFYSWASYDNDAKYPALVVYQAGEATYDEGAGMVPSSLVEVPDERGVIGEGTTGLFLRRLYDISTMLTLEVWANDEDARDALVCLVEDAMRPVDWMAGVRLRCPYYFNAHMDFALNTVSIDDDSDDMKNRMLSARWMVEASIPVYKLAQYTRATLRHQVVAKTSAGR